MSQRRPWTEVELQVMRWGFADSNTADLATALDRPYTAVAQQAAKLGLRKSAEFLASVNSGRVQRGKQHPSMIASQFKAGLVPWNKGTHYVAGGRSAETRFKIGRPASEARNYVPIGSTRVTKDGTLERKVTDDPSIYPARRWTPVARLVWEAGHGPIPDCHAVAFRPGRRTTDPSLITLDALELVSRAELMRRNTFHQYGPEIAKAVQLRGAITRQINKRSKEGATA